MFRRAPARRRDVVALLLLVGGSRSSRTRLIRPTRSPIKNVEVAARALRLELQLLAARAPNEFEAAFALMTKQHAGAVMTAPDTLTVSHGGASRRARGRKAAPVDAGFQGGGRSRGLISYGPSFSEPWRRAAGFVDKLMKGANPAELPVQQPTKFELVINLKTARALGLTIPPTLLARADEVIGAAG